MKRNKQNSHFCYLLRSLNPKFTHSTYIGYTVNPKRRIRQHNREIVNGAHKTHKAMPWEMIVVVYGFPSQKEGLSFEWCCIEYREWDYFIGQHPTKSRICREFITPTLARRRKYISKIEIAMKMLSHSPWCTMNLSMIITNYEIYNEVQTSLSPLMSCLVVLNQPLQFLYDQDIADETISDDDISQTEQVPKNRIMEIVNSNYKEGDSVYVANEFCSSFSIWNQKYTCLLNSNKHVKILNYLNYNHVRIEKIMSTKLSYDNSIFPSLSLFNPIYLI